MYTTLYTPQIPYVVAIGAHAGSATASFKDLVHSCTGELHKPNSRCVGRGSATASFGLGNSLPGATNLTAELGRVLCSTYNIEIRPAANILPYYFVVV